jgi:hypothetical protein
VNDHDGVQAGIWRHDGLVGSGQISGKDFGENDLSGFKLNARSYAWRLHCAEGAIEKSLRSEIMP